ncbi:MAG: hypothetical protein IJY15_05065 [Thermoguttaceae bacterium]|nr:hypothetical protein [Thermoguttaceae bacterium]MBQ9127117.1 hypothetical protein [Thermoguttaceae bacterium]
MFDDFDFGDAPESEPNDYNPYESEPNDCNPYESEPNDYNPYESEANDYNPYASNADSDGAYLYDDASEESQDGILGDSALSPAFGAASSEELDSADAETASPHSSNESGEQNRADPISFGGSGRCKLCGCQEFLWPVNGYMCVNCSHHRDHHI